MLTSVNKTGVSASMDSRRVASALLIETLEGRLLSHFLNFVAVSSCSGAPQTFLAMKWEKQY